MLAGMKSGTMLIPTLIYGYLFFKLKFPVTERVAAGVSNSTMYKSIFTGLFLFMIICMFGTAITELFTGQWIDVLLKNVTDNALLILNAGYGCHGCRQGFCGTGCQAVFTTGCIAVYRPSWLRSVYTCWVIPPGT